MKTMNKQWLYENDNDNSNRYILGTKGNKPLICFGINPSKAEPVSLDNTMISVERIAQNNCFDSWTMLNIYPQRATGPNGINKELYLIIHEKNLRFINQFLSEYEYPIIWAAWGTLIEKRPFLMKCLVEIYQLTLKYNCKWVSLGKKSLKV